MRIVTRKAWGAKPARDKTYQDPRSVREIFVHYSESSSPGSSFDAQAQSVRTIQAFHQGPERGWSDVGYSYLLVNSSVPRVFAGRGCRVVPAAQANHNTNTVAVCVITTGQEKLRWQTKLQLRRLIWHLRRRKLRRNAAVRPHSAVTETSCPGDQLRAFIEKHYK